MYNFSFLPQLGVGNGSLWIFFLSILAAVAVAAVFLPKSRKDSYSGFLKSLYEFLHFEKYWIPSIVRFLYLFVLCYALINGLYLMFGVNFFLGLATMVLTPVVARLVIEGILVLYSLREDLHRVRELLEKKDREE